MKIKKLALVLAMIMISTLFALIVGELILRQLVPFPQPQFLQLDPDLGHRHRANVAGYFTREGQSFVQINSHGFRDMEYSVQKTAKKRVVVLGDSYTEAMQVDLKDTYHDLLEKEFQAQLEVLNFGVSGFGTCQELLMYQHYARQFNPDIVVLAFYPENDFMDNVKQLAQGYPRPYCNFTSGRLKVDNSFRNSSKHRRPSSIYQLYYLLTDRFIIFSLLDKMRYLQGFQKKQPEVGGRDEVQKEVQSSLLYAPTSTEHRDAWLVTEQLIVQLAAMVKADGAQFVLFVQDTLPGQLTVEGNAFYVETRLGKLCQREAIICGFVAPAAVAFAKSTGKPLHGFVSGQAGHWNLAGHRVAYNELRSVFLDQGLIPVQ